MNEISENRNSNALPWLDTDKLDKVKEMFAPDSTDLEFSLFIEIGKALNANPFKRELYFTKFNGKPSYMASINLYRRVAVTHSDYDGHLVRAIYTNETISYTSNGIDHKQLKKEERGELMGAYCIAFKKGVKYPIISEVEINEYIQSFGLWKTKPLTMIKKVAESQALRVAFPEELNGTYSDAEDWNDSDNTDKTTVVPVEDVQAKVKKVVTPSNEYDKEAIERVFNNSITPELFEDDIINLTGDWIDKVIKNKSKTQEEIIVILQDKHFEALNKKQ